MVITNDELAAIRQKLEGELALTDEVALLLADLVSKSDVHLEIGAFWGGSAVLAALAGARHVISIESMDSTFFTTGKKPVTAERMLNNFARFQVAHRISLVKARSNPWPLPPLQVVTAFIDGDHSYEGCLADWLHLKDMTLITVMFHDYYEKKPGVMRVIDEVVRQDPDWYEIGRAGTLIAFSRVGITR